MDGSTDSNVPAGTSGPESNIDNANGSVTELDRIEGAIDPDAARATGSEGAGSDDFAAAFSDAAPAAEGTRTKRKYTKRKAGQQSTAREDAAVKSKLNWIEKAIFGIHDILGTALAPELKLEHEESQAIADAVDGIREAYGIPKMDPKTEALMNLGTVLSGVYGTRAVAIYIRKTTEPKAQRPSASVHPIRPVENPTPPRPQPSQAGGGFTFDPGKIIDGPPIQ